jgi:hypothetical protein
MMAPTHVAVSLLIYLVVEPALGTAAFLPALIGGLIPDVDMFQDHRKDAHYPVLYSFIATALFSVDFRLASVFFLSAALHCIMEIAGNDADHFTDKDKGAVYDHIRQEWIPGRKIIRIDGGNRDLTLLAVLSIPLLVYGESIVRALTVISLITGIAYNRIRDRVDKVFPEFLLR